MRAHTREGKKSEEEDEARKWDIDVKAGGKPIPSDQEGRVYWWPTAGGRSHATPKSWEAAAVGDSQSPAPVAVDSQILA